MGGWEDLAVMLSQVWCCQLRSIAIYGHLVIKSLQVTVPVLKRQTFHYCDPQLLGLWRSWLCAGLVDELPRGDED